MRIQWMLAVRYLRGRMQRSFLTTLSVILGVTILFGMNGLLPPVLESFRHSMYTSAGTVDITISSVSNSTFNQNTLASVQATSGVSAAEGYLSRNVILPASLGGAADTLNGISSVDLTGVDPAVAQASHVYTLASGRFLEVSDTDAIVVSQSLATTLHLNVGDNFKLPSSLGTVDLQVVGILNNVNPTAQNQVYVPLATTQKILNLPQQINVIDVLLTADADKNAVSTQLINQLGDSFKVGAFETGAELFAALNLGKAMMWFFGIAALSMAGFIIFNTFRTVIAERRRDLAMLRAIGANRRTLMGMILTESLLQGIIGTALGIALGALMAVGLLKGLSSILQSYLHVTIGAPIFTTSNWIGSILLGVGFTVASAYFPAKSAMNVTPIEALRPALGATEYRKNRNRAIIGLVLVVIAVIGLVVGESTVTSIALMLFLVGLILITPVLVRPVAVIFSGLFRFLFVREGNLARENLSRQPGRSATTASAMMIGLAITIAMIGMMTSIWSGFMGYLDKSLGSDLIMMPTSLVLGGGNLGAAPSLANELRNVNGVSGVATLRLATSQTKGASLQVIGIDPASYPQISGLEFSKGDPEKAYAAMQAGRAVIVNGIFSSTNNIKVGEQITLKTPQGDEIYTVVGIAMDYLNAKLATAYISQANLEKDFNQTSDVLFMIDRKAGADAVKVNASLQEVANAYPAFTLYDATTFKLTQQALFTKAMSAVYVLLVFLTIPGLIAMANTMSINVIERTREIGMLRAVGSSRPQIRRLILAESLLLSALGTVTGIAVGLFLSSYIVKALNFYGFKLGFYFPTVGVIAAIVVGLSFGILASLAPARKAAKSQIVEALRYE
jgi:putative ABC transport system permease protein